MILNHHFRIQPKNIEPDGVVQAPLDIFVAGYGQRFNFKTMQITDLVLKAKRPNGEPFEVRYEFRKGGLDDALVDSRGKADGAFEIRARSAVSVLPVGARHRPESRPGVPAQRAGPGTNPS